MGSKISCPQDREPRLWTLKAYEGLTVDLTPRFGVKPMMCTNFRAVDVNPGAILNEIISRIESTAGEDEEFSVWLKGLLIILIRIWGYVRKIRGARVYRVVLRKFIIIALLVEAINTIIEKLVDFIKELILQIDELKKLQEMLNCEGVLDEQQPNPAPGPDSASS